MGKIPGAKHHGAKFPEEQRKKRDAKIANKVPKVLELTQQLRGRLMSFSCKWYYASII